MVEIAGPPVAARHAVDDPTVANLRPTARPTVMSLLVLVNHDVRAWADYKGGAADASRNPRYCYEWAYESPGRPTVLNLWYDHLRREGDRIVLADNLRATATRLRTVATRSALQQAPRARAFDEAVHRAAVHGTPIRAILNHADDTRADGDAERRVRWRALDPLPWAVRSYDVATGAFVLLRDAEPTVLVDQFDAAPQAEAGVPTRREVTTFVPDRSAAVRQRVLARSGGACEWCGVRGFPTAAGGIYLETHHVVPLAADGADDDANVVALCATHHREAHHGADRAAMRDALLALACAKSARRGRRAVS